MSEIESITLSLKTTKLAVIGLGYVGLPLAVEFGKHRSVVGFDIHNDRIKELKNGIDCTLEVDEEELKRSFKIFSITTFVDPYGLVGLMIEFSEMGLFDTFP